MPIQAERIEAGIYCARWIDTIASDDLYAAGDAIERLADADGVEEYVLIVDGTQAKKLPFHLQSYTNSVKRRTAAILVLNAPVSGEIMGQMFNRLMPLQVKFFKDWEVLLEAAHTIAGANRTQE